MNPDQAGMKMMEQVCELCQQAGGTLLWRSAKFRVIRVDDPQLPGFCRVIWAGHVREMTDLSPDDRTLLMRAVFAVEHAVRELFQPDKINLASLGNVVPHLHWHIIPRWRDDRHFPDPIWAQAQRSTLPARPAISDRQLAETLAALLSGID